MKRLVNELGVIAIATIFLLSLLQPFGIDQMGKQRMLLIVCGTLLTILSSFIAFVLIGRKKWNGVRGLLLFHAVNIPLLSAMVLTLLSWFTWDSLTKGWYCTAGEFSVINYLKVCAEVALLSFFILILQLYRLRNTRLQQELDEVRAINQLLEERQTEEPPTASDELPTACVLRGNAKNAVVFPSPGGPCSSVWSSGSPRYLAASTNTSKFSTIFFWPLKSLKLNGRNAFSKSFSTLA